MARLYFKYGTMASGKSAALIGIAKNYEIQGKRVIIISSAMDNRFGEGVVASRNGLKAEALLVDRERDIFALVNSREPGKLHCVLVDEAQFLTREQVLQLTGIVDELDLPVIAFGLKNDFQNELFEGSKALILYADRLDELKTVCWFCNRKATMNLRLCDGKPVYDGEQIQVGGSESYLPVCRRCYKHPPQK